jgi:hypothetical protein
MHLFLLPLPLLALLAAPAFAQQVVFKISSGTGFAINAQGHVVAF